MSVGKCRKGIDRGTTLAADTVLRTDASTAYCLLEAHASFPGGLGKSLWAFQPQIGVVTTVGDDHFTNYRSRKRSPARRGS